MWLERQGKAIVFKYDSAEKQAHVKKDDVEFLKKRIRELEVRVRVLEDYFFKSQS